MRWSIIPAHGTGRHSASRLPEATRDRTRTATTDVRVERRRTKPHEHDTTDPEIRHELIETVRRFIAREVMPVASEMEHADAYPEAIVEQMKELGLFGITIPEEYGGLGLDLLTYIGVIEELAYGWMSLSGIVNTHTIAAYLIMHHGTEEQKRALAAAARDRRDARLLVAVANPTRAATRATSRAAPSATARST